MKDFDVWNKKKKVAEGKPAIVGVHEREIWWVSLGLNIGIEADGKNEDFERPCLVIRKFNKDMVWVLPLTSKIRFSVFYEKFTYEGREYFAALTQIRTVSTKRLLRKTGMIPSDDFKNINKRVVSFFQTNETPL